MNMFDDPTKVFRLVIAGFLVSVIVAYALPKEADEWVTEAGHMVEQGEFRALVRHVKGE